MQKIIRQRKKVKWFYPTNVFSIQTFGFKPDTKMGLQAEAALKVENESQWPRNALGEKCTAGDGVLANGKRTRHG